MITGQQQRVRARYPDTPAAELALFPRLTRNREGKWPIVDSVAASHHRTWVDSLPALQVADGREFDKTAVFLYAYRHSFAQRHADAGTPVDVLKDLMGHRSMNTTQLYYSVTAKRVRAAVDTLAAFQFDRGGDRVWSQARALLESEHQRLAVGQIAVPFGVCSEPSNVKAGGGACPFRFRCLGCGHFRSVRRALSSCLGQGRHATIRLGLRVASDCVLASSFRRVHLIFFSPTGWQDWDVEREPLIRSGMPVLIENDLRLEDDAGPRASALVNRWLRELPVSGAPSPNTWEAYARALRDWLAFLGDRGVAAFDSRDRLRAVLSVYAEYRLAGPPDVRLAESSWNLHVTAVARFYEWAVDEGHATAVPFTYAWARRFVQGEARTVRRNLAKLKEPKPATTIKYLEPDFAELFVQALEGLQPDGAPDPDFRGHDPSRNATMARFVLASGLRRREFTYLLAPEVPPLPPEPTALPVLLPVPGKIAKGGKQRTTWVSYDALAAVHRYLELERPLAAEGSSWRPDPRRGEPLVVTYADWRGGVINGRRRPWSGLGPAERLRLVDEQGGSLLLAVQRDGAPFVDWATVFRRASDRIRDRFEPRFPNVYPHRLRHSFSLGTLEDLVSGYYAQAAKLVADTDNNAALALYLTKADPIQVLRDLLGHSSVLTTQVYLSRIDLNRVFREIYEDVGRQTGLSGAILAEVDDELADEPAAAR